MLGSNKIISSEPFTGELGVSVCLLIHLHNNSILTLQFKLVTPFITIVISTWWFF